ncbi:MAG: cytochrome-c peroxidase [Terriglobales bacterium]
MNVHMRCNVLFPGILVFGTLVLMAFPMIAEDPPVSQLLGLPFVMPPADNPITPEKVALGRKLFFDKRLSSDNSIACATCHDPSYGFADPHAVSTGVKGRHGERNSPTVLNIAFVSPVPRQKADLV